MSVGKSWWMCELCENVGLFTFVFWRWLGVDGRAELGRWLAGECRWDSLSPSEPRGIFHSKIMFSIAIYFNFSPCRWNKSSSAFAFFLCFTHSISTIIIFHTKKAVFSRLRLKIEKIFSCLNFVGVWAFMISHIAEGKSSGGGTGLRIKVSRWPAVDWCAPPANLCWWSSRLNVVGRVKIASFHQFSHETKKKHFLELKLSFSKIYWISCLISFV